MNVLINYIKKILFSGGERTVLANKNIIGMAFLKVFSLLLSMIIVPMTIGYISSYQYGIWLTLSSFLSWFSFFDIGLGNGLRNKLVEALACDDKEKARIYISTTYALLSGIIIFAWIVLIVLTFNVNWASFLNVPQEMNNDLKIIMLVMFSNFSFQFILRLVTTILNSFQKPVYSSLFDTIAQVFVVILIVIAKLCFKGSLLVLALIQGCSQTIVLLVATIYLFSHSLKEYKPTKANIKYIYAKDLMGLGFKFFWLQILSILSYSINNIIISRFAGPEDVTIYNLAYKYMYMLQMLFTIIITPFWSASGEAYVKKDFEWLRNLRSRLIKVYFLICAGGIVMLIISPIFYKIWVKDIEIPFKLSAVLLLYFIFNIWITLFSNIIYGIGKIKVEMIRSSITCVLNVPISILGCKYGGMFGLCLSQTVFMLFSLIWGPIQLNKLINENAIGIWDK